jgi:hypothetical protein
MFDKWCSKLCFALATKLYDGRRGKESELRDCRLAKLPIVQYTLMAVFPVGLWGRTKARMALILFPPTVL